MSNFLMMDFETLGISLDSVIISIGACFFDIKTGTIGKSYYQAIDINGQIKDGRKIDGDTIKWWMEQDNAAKKVFKEQAIPIRTALLQFNNWITINSIKTEINVWGNGATFDISLSENLFRQYNLDIPWSYKNIMDLRTFSKYVANGESIKKIGTAHNALDDAISQANYVIKYTKGK